MAATFAISSTRATPPARAQLFINLRMSSSLRFAEAMIGPEVEDLSGGMAQVFERQMTAPSAAERVSVLNGLKFQVRRASYRCCTLAIQARTSSRSSF